MFVEFIELVGSEPKQLKEPDELSELNEPGVSHDHEHDRERYSARQDTKMKMGGLSAMFSRLCRN